MNIDRSAITALALFGLLGLGFAAIGLRHGPSPASPPKLQPAPEMLPPPRTVEASTRALYVSVSAPGFSAEAIEKTIANRLERALIGLEGLASVRTRIENGQCRLTLNLAAARDPHAFRTEVQNTLSGMLALLPAGILPPRLEPRDPGALPDLWIAASDDRRTESEISSIVKDIVDKQLLTIPGISHIGLHGERRTEMQLLIDPEKMVAFGLTYSEIVDALSKTIVVSGKLEEIVVARRNDFPILLRDVGVIRETTRRESFASFDGRQQVVAGIHLTEGANVAVVAAAIRAQLRELKFPESLKVALVADENQKSGDWVLVECQFATGSRIEDMQQHAAEIERLIREQLPPSEIGPILTLGPKSNQAELLVQMLVPRTAGHALDTSEIQARVRMIAKRFSGVTLRTARIDAAPTPRNPDSSATVRLTSGDLRALELWSAETVRLASGETSGLTDVSHSGLSMRNEIRTTIDRERAAQLGLSAQDVSQAIQAATGSPQIRMGEFWITIGPTGGRDSIASLEQRVEDYCLIPIFVKDKKSIRLKDVATLEQVLAPAVIEHWNGKRCVTITANPTAGTTSALATATLRSSPRKPVPT